ncbi:MAG: aspartyl/asparaginyl beta-hydroxylase domain-containing protein [Bdellovibrionaceae bacterium]|nr:aspartyl/asparaginyl beta-hydroxylase domain-containing protein [Pseudobdellovibrionaceae bacterium]
MADVDWGSIQRVNTERMQLFQQLHLYGDVIPLDHVINLDLLDIELKSFEKSWVPYNAVGKKKSNPREGLSVTSLDGGMSGVPDLFSLYEWSKETGRKVSECDFNVPTEAYRKCTAIHRLCEPFMPNVGRCRFVRFQPGGHFPPHRDGSVSYQIPDYFRILVPLNRTGDDRFHFVLDGRLVSYEPGRPYLFNALKTHSVVSFEEGAVTLALSVALTQENVAKAISFFKIY